jgi:hypothetical protein
MPLLETAMLSVLPEGPLILWAILHRYVLELDDATKVLNNEDRDPVNF